MNRNKMLLVTEKTRKKEGNSFELKLVSQRMFRLFEDTV